MALRNSVSEKSLTVLTFLQDNDGENLTSQDIADALGMEKRSVDGVITSGLIRNKNLCERVPAQIQMEDGTFKDVKFIALTDAGRAYNHEEAVAADAAAKAEKAAAKEAE